MFFPDPRLFRICGTTLQIHLDHSDPIDNCIINYRKILLLNTIHCTDSVNKEQNCRRNLEIMDRLRSCNEKFQVGRFLKMKNLHLKLSFYILLTLN